LNLCYVSFSTGKSTDFFYSQFNTILFFLPQEYFYRFLNYVFPTSRHINAPFFRYLCCRGGKRASQHCRSIIKRTFVARHTRTNNESIKSRQ
jgi:hypothetical protein